MPRPGPRPYECVRRAWHSDRHQPIRGSLIRDIFRLANEVHNPATRINKEWLDKLPLVVLKAEEIMYSKANSEAEYLDLKTLWERTNDAIDTIIRKDNTPESEGDFLQPCIEAALNLGCIPRRASRSQRHNNPECYLSSVNKEFHNLGSSTIHLLPQISLSQLESWYSAFVAANKSSHNNEASKTVPDGSTNICPSHGQVHPSYYHGNEQPKDSSGKKNADTVNFLHDFIGSGYAKSILNSSKNTSTNKCDLSLRLGLISHSSSIESAWTREFDDVGSSSSCNERTYFNPPTNFERFIPIKTSDERLESYSMELRSGT